MDHLDCRCALADRRADPLHRPVPGVAGGENPISKRGRGRSARRIRVRGRFSRIYCGGGRRPFGSLRRCRSRLAASLNDALAVPERSLYSGDAVCKAAGRDGDQACFDAIFFRPLGGITQPLMPWVNRPTFQHAVEVGAP